MGEICMKTEMVLGLLEEVGRSRVLADHETDIIEDCLAMEVTAFRWNPRLDVALLVSSSSNGGIARFARRHEITPNMAYVRLFRLRKRKARQDDAAEEQG